MAMIWFAESPGIERVFSWILPSNPDQKKIESWQKNREN